MKETKACNRLGIKKENFDRQLRTTREMLVSFCNKKDRCKVGSLDRSQQNLLVQKGFFRDIRNGAWKKVVQSVSVVIPEEVLVNLKGSNLAKYCDNSVHVALQEAKQSAIA